MIVLLFLNFYMYGIYNVWLNTIWEASQRIIQYGKPASQPASQLLLLAPNTLNNFLAKPNSKKPWVPWWSLGVTWGWFRGVSGAGSARVGVN